MGYERQTLSLLMQDGFWMPLRNFHIVPFRDGIYSLEGDVVALLKLAGVNGVVSFLADRDCYALPLRYRDIHGIYMTFMWVFKDFGDVEMGYPQSIGWFKKRTQVARLTTVDFFCCALNNALGDVFDERPQLEEQPLVEQIALMYQMYRNILLDYPYLEPAETPLYPPDYNEEDEDAKPVGYIMRFTDGLMSICQSGFVSVPATSCVIKAGVSGALRTVKPAQLDMETLQWPQ